MASLGKYAELPLPDEWLGTLGRLRPIGFSLKRPSLPNLGAQLGKALAVLSDRDCDILISRLARGDKLDAIGQRFGITRERVRQLEKRALKKLWSSSADLFAAIDAWLSAHDNGGFVAFERGGFPYGARPELDPEELLKCVIESYLQLSQSKYQLAPLPADGWCLFDAKRVALGAGRSYLRRTRRFASLDNAAVEMNVEPYDIALGWPIFEGLYLTCSGLLGCRDWTMLDFMEAIAWELAESGVTEWHFSQMAKALTYVLPDKFTEMPGRNVAAALSRRGADAFQYAGKKGTWCLSALGDGFDDNTAAIVAVLERAGTVLHYSEIATRLDRQVRLGTIYAILSRDMKFVGYGDGVYGLATADRRALSSSTGRTSDIDEQLTRLLLGELQASDTALRHEFPETSTAPEQTRDVGERGSPLDASSATRSELAKRVLGLLSATSEPLRGRDIARKIGADLHAVNRVLHVELASEGAVLQDGGYRWEAVGGADVSGAGE